MAVANEFTKLSTREVASRARAASRTIGILPGDERNRLLQAMAAAVNAASADLLDANAADLAAAEAQPSDRRLSASTLSRLELTPAKLDEMVEQIRSVAQLDDPLGRTLDAVELDPNDPVGAKSIDINTIGSDTNRGLRLQKISVPLGVLAVIFEARPDAVTQIASLALKSGNAAILKAGREVEYTAIALVEVLRRALESNGAPADAVSLVLGREAVQELLAMHDLVDMVIPRGSKALVEHVQANTRIPVLGHAEGVCHIYVDAAADIELALRVIEDAKLDYPAACNAVETVLVHRGIAPHFVPLLGAALSARGVRLHADSEVRALLRDAADVQPVHDWHCEYGEPELAIGIVDSVDAAIAHIHRHGSLHTESILSEDAAVAEKFLREVDAAGVFHNASTRFADGFRYGFGAEVGISTSKFHARGPVGLEGLTTYKYILRGHGHVAGDYRGANARSFTHRKL